MSEKQTKVKSKMNLRFLRISLKYRPEVLKLILKMRQCIRRRNSALKTLKHRLKNLESIQDLHSKAEALNSETVKNVGIQAFINVNNKEFKDSSTQTNDEIKHQETKLDTENKDAGWNLKENGESEKSIAEQVKEAAQSVLEDRGMVYVESAGMYYDYKTGYYYNSELGLYYHPDTGCYYHYSNNQFVFHSYPDMSKVNSALIAHQKKKERKLKRERRPEDDIDNLTKHLSQDKEEDSSKPKKRKTKKGKKEKGKKSETAKDIPIEKIATDDKSANSDDKVNDSNKEQNQDGVDNESTSISMNLDKDEVVLVEDDTPIEDKGENSANDVENETKTENIEENANELENKVSEPDKEDEKEAELEDGECSDTGSEQSDSESEAESECSIASTATVSDEDSVAKQHPPCMRVIVRETKLPKLKVGSLFLITKDGGTVGREGEQHSILLRDHNVSRTHLDIKYDMAKKAYVATDLGSKNGTVLNGTRMSESQEISLPLVVLHGSVIQLGETKLLCHIHPGNSTCGQCEPGLLMQVEEEKKAAYTRTVSVKKQHELELARLKNIYAPQRLAIEEKPYNDRAQARREAVGSTNHAEKTHTTDLDTAIAPDNKGFKLLEKMGWSKGEGLGKDSQGDTEPVPLVSNEGKSGLGTAGAVAPPSNTPMPRVKNNLASGALRLASRTKMLQPPAKAFQTSLDDDESE